MPLRNLGDRDAGHGGDTALVVLPDHADVAGLTPSSAPAVPDDPVVLATLSAIADSANTVVEVVRGAGRLVIDTTGVELEGPLGSIDSNADWAILSALGGEVILITQGDREVLADGANTLGSIELAGLLDGLVRVVRLEVELATLLGDDVVEGRGHETTVAAKAAVNAVDKVGLGEGEKLALDLSPLGLDSLDSGEGPARAAGALVLDVVNPTVLPVIDGVWVVLRGDGDVLSVAGGEKLGLCKQ